ncbi:helix-turn-helix transcriptional regulator [Streptomyces sp. NPDC017991]|uniref:helix-turn-helix transcriptional regulator n=1 Tax=Streptomyces sp. NPDC017991 TaxID=3365026 RepID=UPI0037A7AAEA
MRADDGAGSVRTGTRGEDSRDNALGEFLRTCRSHLTPTDVGLRAGGRRRRVEGLRREEVSVLTGISVDYYARLEQGRERRPSARITEALSRGLHLDGDARNHLFRLAGLNPNLRPDSAREQVHPELLRLLEASDRAVAYVLSPSFDILVANAHAQALLSPFAGTGGVANIGFADGSQNLIRILFTHPQARNYFAEWPSAVTASLRTLRRNAVRLPGDTEIADLVTDLSAGSADFTKAWQDGVRQDGPWQDGARPDRSCRARTAVGLDRAYRNVVHPVAGRITLTYRVLGTAAVPGQRLLLAAPVPGSRSAQAFTYLVAMGGPPP